MSVNVKQATLRGGFFLSYKYDVNVNNAVNTNSTSSDAVVHDDLRLAFRNLIPFFAHVCEEITDEQLVKNAIENPELHLVKSDDEDEKKPFLKYRVDSFEMGKRKDGEAVILSGLKYLEKGEAVGFSTPLIKFDSDYAFAIQLANSVSHARSEVFEYMQGKQAETNDSIVGLFEGEEDPDDDGI